MVSDWPIMDHKTSFFETSVSISPANTVFHCHPPFMQFCLCNAPINSKPWGVTPPPLSSPRMAAWSLATFFKICFEVCFESWQSTQQFLVQGHCKQHKFGCFSVTKFCAITLCTQCCHNPMLIHQISQGVRAFTQITGSTQSQLCCTILNVDLLIMTCKSRACHIFDRFLQLEFALVSVMLAP